MASVKTKGATKLIKEIVETDLSKFVSPYLQKYLAKLDPEYINLDESSLLDKIRKDVGNSNWQPKPIVESIRQRFWEEFELSQRYSAQVSDMRLIENLTTKGILQATLEDPISLAWVCCKPIAYDQTIQSLLNMGYRRLEEIMRLPLRDSTGKVNEKLVSEIIKSTALLEARKFGSIIQRSQQHITQQVENVTTKQVNAELVTDIDKRIQELEAKLLSNQALLPPPKENDGEKENT